jgi:hypothetical protein
MPAAEGGNPAESNFFCGAGGRAPSSFVWRFVFIERASNALKNAVPMGTPLSALA